MNQFSLTPEQQLRFEKIRSLAHKCGNMSLSLVEGHLNPYRDISPARLKDAESVIFDTFMKALPEADIPVLLWADARARSFLSNEYATKQSCRGNVFRFVVTDKKWFVKNWQLFAGDLGFGVRRKIFVFMAYSKESLSHLMAPWWDPNVLTNPGVKNSRSLLNEVRDRVRPGTVVFSLSMLRLASCEIYFHPDDLDIVTECVCTSAHKQDWWKD